MYLCAEGFSFLRCCCGDWWLYVHTYCCRYTNVETMGDAQSQMSPLSDYSTSYMQSEFSPGPELLMPLPSPFPHMRTYVSAAGAPYYGAAGEGTSFTPTYVPPPTSFHIPFSSYNFPTVSSAFPPVSDSNGGFYLPAFDQSTGPILVDPMRIQGPAAHLLPFAFPHQQSGPSAPDYFPYSGDFGNPFAALAMAAGHHQASNGHHFISPSSSLRHSRQSSSCEVSGDDRNGQSRNLPPRLIRRLGSDHASASNASTNSGPRIHGRTHRPSETLEEDMDSYLMNDSAAHVPPPQNTFEEFPALDTGFASTFAQTGSLLSSHFIISNT